MLLLATDLASRPARLRPLAAASVLGVLAALAALGCAPPGPPNVVLITIDTLRADRLSAYGYHRATSPEIDALASQGVLFERAIAASSATAPSHATMLTSRHVREHSISYFNGKSRLEFEGVGPQQFRDAGYATGAFVGNYMLQPRTGFDAGFDVFNSDLDTIRRGDEAIFERRAEATAEQALAWLDANRERPFFMWFHLQDPHGPYEAPDEYLGRFEPEAATGRELPVVEDRYGHLGIPKYQEIPGEFSTSTYEARYADEIYYADRSVGELLRALDALDRDSVVLLTSDHGESLGEGGYYYVHSHVTTPDIAHVPFIVRAKGIRPGRRSELVGHVDVLPTLLDLAGLPVPAGARGIALGPLLREDRALPDRTLFCDMGHELAAYRGDRFDRVVNVAPTLLDVKDIPAQASEGAPAPPSWGTSGERRRELGLGPRWWRYRWAANGSDFEFETQLPVASASAAIGAAGAAPAALDPEVLAYLGARAARTVYLDDITPADLLRLRALGYW